MKRLGAWALAFVTSGCFVWNAYEDPEYSGGSTKSRGCGSSLESEDGLAMQCFGKLDAAIHTMPVDGVVAMHICNSPIEKRLPLERFSQLRALVLMRIPTPFRMPPLSSLPQLRSLDLTGYKPTDEGFAFLASPSQLKSLRLRDVNVEDLRGIGHLRSLERLDLTNVPIADLTPLQSLASLRTLVLHGTHVDDLTPLAALHDLEELDVSYTAVRDIAPLASLSKLRKVLLEGNYFHDLEPLHGLKHLERVGLARVPVGHDERYALEKAVNVGRADGDRLIADTAGHSHFGGTCPTGSVNQNQPFGR
jgi:hypothetical protein